MDDYTITDWHVDEGEDGNSILTVHFIPWVTGSIQLPAIGGKMLSPMTVVPMSPSVGDDVTARVVFTPSDDVGDLPPPVVVVSVLQQDVAQAQPRPQQGPLFSPITIHALYASAGAVVCALMVLCVAAAKWRKIHAWFRLSAMQAAERRNAKALKRRLAELLKSAASDAAFCTELQQAIRSYLGTRFDEDFAPLTTGEVAARVAAQTAVAAAETEEAYDDVIDALRRADYVRFSGAPLEASERDGLVEQVLTASDVLRGKTNA